MPVTTNTRKLAALLGASGAGIGTDGLLQAAAVDANIATQAELDALETETDEMRTNIALVAFKAATAGSLAKYNLQDQVIDDFADATGIDATPSTNHTLTSGVYSSGALSANYFGSDADGTVTTSGSVTHTVLSKNGSYDGDMLVKNYTNLTIAAGHTMTVDQPCRGMLIFVSGDCVINGTLSMTERGALGNPASSGGSDSNAVGVNGIRIGFQTAGGSTTFTNDATEFNGCGTTARTAVDNFGNTSSNGTVLSSVRIGGVGGAAFDSGGDAAITIGNSGGTLTNGTGGGGSGFEYDSTNGQAGAGGAGTCFSGGAGGGGANKGLGTVGVAYGGAGGTGSSGHNAFWGGGAGNPFGANGTSGYWSGGTQVNGGGLGGLLWLIVGGDLTIGGSGSIEADGAGGGALTDGTGATGSGTYSSGGGCGGGGRVVVAYAGTLSNSGAVTAAGGVSQHVNLGNNTGDGGTGGAGDVDILQITTATTYANLTLQSLDTEAEAQPNYADMVMLMEDTVGTATINTDIKGWISRDSGTTFTQGTLVDEGDWGTNKRIMAFHDLDISGQPADQTMCYKITTHNQAVGKQTKIHATSMGWR